MFESKLIRFLAKRAAILLVLLSAADIALLGQNRWLILAGLLAGACISVGRVSSNEWMLKKVFQSSGNQAATGSIVLSTMSLLLLMPVIAITYFLNIWALYGLIAGLLNVPVVIMVNSITEAFGITKNNFE